ncbi:MAG: hypothetical protein EZS28_001453, partial [Streblomastix strix]
SRSRGYSRSRDYKGTRETRINIDGNQNGYETRDELRGRVRGTLEKQRRMLSDDPNDGWTIRTQMEKDSAEKHNNRDSSWTENETLQHPNSSSTTQTTCSSNTMNIQQEQVQQKQLTPVQIPRQRGRKDVASNQDDIDEHEILQEKLAALQREKQQQGISESENDWQQIIEEIDNNNSQTPKQAQQQQQQQMNQQSVFSQTAKYQIQQKTPNTKAQQKIASSIQRMISTVINKDKPSSHTQQPDTSTQKATHRAGDKQRQKKIEREIKRLQTGQQFQQQGNNDINNLNVDVSDIQGTVGQLPRENAEEEEEEEDDDEQVDEEALIQSKDYRVNINSYLPVQENLGIQPQNNQGLNTLGQMKKEKPVPAPVGVQEKLKKGKGSKNIISTEDFNASNEPSQGNNDQTQIYTASTVPKPNVASKRGRKMLNQFNSNQKTLVKRMKGSRTHDRAGTLQPGEISVEISIWNRRDKRADEDSSQGE